MTPSLLVQGATGRVRVGRPLVEPAVPPDVWPPGPYNLIMDGQSLVNTPVGASTAFLQLVALLDDTYWPENEDVAVAVSGTYYYQRSNGGTYSATTRVDPYFSVTSTNVIVDLGGQSDLIPDGALHYTGPELLADVETYITQRKAVDPDLIYVVATVPPSSFFTGDSDDNRLDYNTLLTTDAYTPGLIDGVADIATITELQNPANATYFSDGLHWTATGAGLGVAKIKVDLAAMGLNV